MRRISFWIANYITNKYDETHEFRYSLYYLLLELVVQLTQVFIILLLSFWFGNVLNSFILLIVYFLFKLSTSKFINYYHATSFLMCTIIGLSLFVTASRMSLVIGLLFIMIITFLLTFGLINEKIDRLSIKIDKRVLYLWKKLKYVKEYIIKTFNDKIYNQKGKG